jgi:hypothetical protein
MKVVRSLATLLASRRVVKMIFFRPNNRPRHFKKTATFTVDRVPVCTLIVSVFEVWSQLEDTGSISHESKNLWVRYKQISSPIKSGFGAFLNRNRFSSLNGNGSPNSNDLVMYVFTMTKVDYCVSLCNVCGVGYEQER